MSHYLFENAGAQTGQRFACLETLYDPWTTRHLEATGLGPGWQCWEVGGGGGSIAAWLGTRCGPSGSVLVTDIDPRFLTGLETLDPATTEIQRHDIGTDPLPARSFDLIHARLVLLHVPEREQTLARLVTALKPGGWLVLEDFDSTFIDPWFPTADAQAAARFEKMFVAVRRCLSARSGEQALRWGRSLYQRLRAAGLVEVGMEGYLPLLAGGSPGARMHAANFEQVREEAVEAGFITQEEVDQVLRLLNDPNFAVSASILFTAWGQRPTPTMS